MKNYFHYYYYYYPFLPSFTGFLSTWTSTNPDAFFLIGFDRVLIFRFVFHRFSIHFDWFKLSVFTEFYWVSIYLDFHEPWWFLILLQFTGGLSIWCLGLIGFFSLFFSWFSIHFDWFKRDGIRMGNRFPFRRSFPYFSNSIDDDEEHENQNEAIFSLFLSFFLKIKPKSQSHSTGFFLLGFTGTFGGVSIFAISFHPLGLVSTELHSDWPGFDRVRLVWTVFRVFIWFFSWFLFHGLLLNFALLRYWVSVGGSMGFYRVWLGSIGFWSGSSEFDSF